MACKNLDFGERIKVYILYYIFCGINVPVNNSYIVRVFLNSLAEKTVGENGISVHFFYNAEDREP